MECVVCLAELVDQLPLTNYCILSYLSCFLKQVSDLEDQNRMSASSLGIVFGPNLFRLVVRFSYLPCLLLLKMPYSSYIKERENIFVFCAVSYKKSQSNFAFNLQKCRIHVYKLILCYSRPHAGIYSFASCVIFFHIMKSFIFTFK